MLRFVPILVFLSGPVAEAQQFGRTDFDRFGDIAGAWVQRRGDGALYELWERQNDSTLFGRSFTVRGRDTIPEETVALGWRKSAIRYTPSVARQNEGRPVDFILTRIDNSGFVFENPAHDFPQRIRYQPAGDSLLVMISGTTVKGYREFIFRYSRVPVNGTKR